MLLFDHHPIQTRGFRNTVDKDGNIDGFQVRVRTKYYKGLWPCEVRVGPLTVDGVEYPKEEQIWEIGGYEYKPEDMLEIGDQIESAYWDMNDCATVKVKKPGGLSQGYHTVSLIYGHASREGGEAMSGHSFADGKEHKMPSFHNPEYGITIMTRCAPGMTNERKLLIV